MNIFHILLTLVIGLFLTTNLPAQKIFIDPGHGYTSNGGNPDGRTQTEIHTALDVGLKLKALIDTDCTWSTQISRTQNVGGWLSLNARQSQSDSWGADYFLSIHCNAGGGTGTETFWCANSSPPNYTTNINFATQIQNNMATHGQWTSRRVVEDDSYLPFHLGVLTGNQAYSCLSEIGFVDSNDANKLLNNSWRNVFAQAYIKAFEAQIGALCSNACPNNLNLTGANLSGTYTAGGTITSTGQVQSSANCVFDAGTQVILDPGFDANAGSIFEAKIDGCQ